MAKSKENPLNEESNTSVFSPSSGGALPPQAGAGSLVSGLTPGGHLLPDSHTATAWKPSGLQGFVSSSEPEVPTQHLFISFLSQQWGKDIIPVLQVREQRLRDVKQHS